MPQMLIDPSVVQKTFSMLTLDASNRNLLVSLTPQEEIHLPGLSLAPGYRLIRVNNRLHHEVPQQHFELAVVNDLTQEVVYYNRVIFQPDSFLKHRPVTQILVWRTQKPKHRGALRDVAGKIFTQYLLENYDVVVSDRSQTTDGMSFWHARFFDALHSNMYLYGYDMLTCELREIETEIDVQTQTDWLWSDQDKHQDRLAIVSKFPLPVSP